MRKIPKKNYILLTILILGTFIITIICSKLYLNQSKETSNFYDFCNKITEEEFDQYITEKEEMILYISDKYNLEYSLFEKNFESKIIEYNLQDKLIFMNKDDISNKFISKLKKQYAIDLDLDKTPSIIIISSDSIIYIDQITNDMSTDNIIDYEDLK